MSAKRSRVQYTKELLEPIVAECTTWAEVCRRLGVAPWGGAQSHVTRRARELGLDCSKFRGRGWRKGLRPGPTRPIQEYLVLNSTAKSATLRRRLINEGSKEARCEICNRTEWEGGAIPLELGHKNSNHWDNRLENLQIICPNCHARETEKRLLLRTGTPAGERSGLEPDETKVVVGSTPILCTRICACGRKKLRKSDTCIKCTGSRRKGPRPHTAKITWPDDDTLVKMIERSNYSAVAEELGVTDNAVRKHLRRRGIELPKAYARARR